MFASTRIEQAAGQATAPWSLDDIPTATVTELCARLIDRLQDCGWTIATAESCSAGLLASRLSACTGAETSLLGGFVTYTKAAKTRLLGVDQELIRRHTAVSAQVASAMSRGGLDHSGAELCVALTGVTGSAPDEDGNPRGRIHVAAMASSGAHRLTHCEFGPHPPEMLLDAALRTALLTALPLVPPHRGT